MWKHLATTSLGQSTTSLDQELPTDRLKLFTMVILRVAEARVLKDYLATAEHGFNFDEAHGLIKKFE